MARRGSSRLRIGSTVARIALALPKKPWSVSVGEAAQAGEVRQSAKARTEGTSPRVLIQKKGRAASAFPRHFFGAASMAGQARCDMHPRALSSRHAVRIDRALQVSRARRPAMPQAVVVDGARAYRPGAPARRAHPGPL